MSKVPALDTISKRLPLIFPEGTENRNDVINPISAKTIFVMFYAGAIEGSGRWIRPKQVAVMTDAQAAMTDDDSRIQWTEDTLKSKVKIPPGRWYADTSREGVRDDCIKKGLIPLNAVIERKDLPTTSPKPRYAIRTDLAALFDENLTLSELDERIRQWQEQNLSTTALRRTTLLKGGHVADPNGEAVYVNCPNGERRIMAPGDSSTISKAVIESFSERFLQKPALILLSESRKKIVFNDDEIAREIGININSAKILPDIILFDLGASDPINEALLLFVEVVATDGAITQQRKEQLLALAKEGGYDDRNIAFMTAFMDRNNKAYRKSVSKIAWGTFVWFMSEPDKIIHLNDCATVCSKPLCHIIKE